MAVLTWVVLGLALGFVASGLLGSVRYGIAGDIVYGGVGAVAGGWVGSMLVWIDAEGLSFDSFTLAAFVAVALIVIVSFSLWRRSGDKAHERIEVH